MRNIMKWFRSTEQHCRDGRACHFCRQNDKDLTLQCINLTKYVCLINVKCAFLKIKGGGDFVEAIWYI